MSVSHPCGGLEVPDSFIHGGLAHYSGLGSFGDWKELAVSLLPSE